MGQSAWREGERGEDHGIDLERLFKVALSPAPEAETECDFTEVGMGPYRASGIS